MIIFALLKFAKPIIGLSFLVSVYLFCQFSCASPNEKHVYIDPGVSGNSRQEGTIENPYKNWDAVSLKSNTVYLLKRSTEITLNSLLAVYNKSNVTITAYGKGKTPVVKASSVQRPLDVYNSEHITIKNIKFAGNGNNNFLIRIRGDNENITIDNVVFTNSVWGIRLVGYEQGNEPGEIQIKNCQISDIGDDGIFAQNVHDLLIDSCYIQKVNQKWFYIGKSQVQSPGDGIQLENCRNFTIRNCQIDRTDTGNKFCIIANHSKNGRVENNVLMGPLEKGEGGASIYLGIETDSVLIINNNISFSPCGIYSHAVNNYVYRNVFKENSVGSWFININKAIILNNVYWNNPVALKGSVLKVFNNIFYASALSDHLMHLHEPCETDHNCYFIRQPDMLFKKHGKLPAYTFRTGNGKNSVFGDPLVSNPEEADFSLQEDSPCIDKGIGKVEGWGVIDNVCGEAVDIGVIEWCAGNE
jgi:hypothetical protein